MKKALWLGVIPVSLLWTNFAPTVASGQTTSTAGRQAEFATKSLPSNLKPVPRLNVPLYVMEYHVWWGSPFGVGGMPGYVHWCTTEMTDILTKDSDYIRDTHSIGYPLLGLYNSENREVIRWQLRCLHNTGVDGVFVQLFPDRDTGEKFTRETIWKSILEIAAEEGVKVAIHDEVQFKPQGPAQNPEVMAKRAGEFLKKYKGSPAYLRIGGMPAYTFQMWSNWNGKATPEGIASMMHRANEIAGEPIFWIPYHGADERLYAIPEAKGFLVDSSMRSLKRAVDHPTGELEPTDWSKLEKNLAAFANLKPHSPSKMLGLWCYPGFNDQSRTFSRVDKDPKFSWVPRMEGRTLVGILNTFHRSKPDFIMLSSWNDWEENTAIEPGLRYDGFSGDPYLYCRIVAAAKGRTFIPPPLPPKEAIDPLLWQTLFGVDRTPPKIEARFDKTGQQISATATDSAHGIKSIEASYVGDAYVAVAADNSVVSHGITAPSTRQDKKSGWSIRNNEPSDFEIDGKMLEGANTRDLYLALEMWDETTGRIDITYSSSLQPAQRKRDEANNLQEFLPREDKQILGARITLHGSGNYVAEVRKLRDVDFGQSPMIIRMKLVTEAGNDKAGSARLVRLHLFKAYETPSTVAKGPTESAKAVLRESKILKLPAGLPAPPTAAYISAEDTEGNRTAPNPVIIAY